MSSKDKGSKGKNTRQHNAWEMIGIIGYFFTTASFLFALCITLKTPVLWAIVICLIVPCLIYFLVIWRFEGIGVWWESLSNQVRLLLIASGIAVSCYFILRSFTKASSFLVWGTSATIMGIAIFLSYIFLAQRFHRHDLNLEKAINLMSFSRIASSVFFFDKMKKVTIVFTHRADRNKKCSDYQGYHRPPIPVDEEEGIWLINYLARSAGIEVEIKCSCELIWKKTTIDKNLLKGNLIVLGSPNNPVTKKLHDQAKGINIRFMYGTENDQQSKKSENPSVNDIIDSVKRFESTKENKIYRRDNKNAYGLITRMENPLGEIRKEKHYVVTLGGGHRQGQKAITRWIDDPDHLLKIKEWYPYGPFQILIQGTHQGGEVKDVKLLDRCPSPE